MLLVYKCVGICSNKGEDIWNNGGEAKAISALKQKQCADRKSRTTRAGRQRFSGQPTPTSGPCLPLAWSLHLCIASWLYFFHYFFHRVPAQKSPVKKPSSLWQAPALLSPFLSVIFPTAHPLKYSTWSLFICLWWISSYKNRASVWSTMAHTRSSGSTWTYLL